MLRLFRRKSIDEILRQSVSEGDSGLKQKLNVRDLTSLGIAAIIGAGIFSTIGNAAVNGGPAVSILFIFTAMACGFSALAYAQFASTIPISGSAYTYAYASMGELIAWIIGWDLIMEYAVGNIAVAISWSDYFTALLNGMGLHIPEHFSVDYLSASRGFSEASALLGSGQSFESLKFGLQESFMAWSNAPEILGVKIIADVPAFAIVVFITSLVYIGIYESKVAGNIMVILKLLILFVVIGVGAFYVNPSNWSPFAPNGLGGVMKGVAGVFFAYIGFDAISTTAEECKNPRRDLPRAMIYSLLITTVLYILISLVLTGMVHYSKLGVGDPLAFAFQYVNMDKLSGIIAFSAVIAMASVLLVFQVGQPRIWMSMSRDGLLPPVFSKIHSKFRTPWFATLITGILVAVPSLFMNLTEVTDLTSIGTLFAFILVSAGVIIMDKNNTVRGSFRIPFISSRKFLPLVWILISLIMLVFFNEELTGFFKELNISDWDVFKHEIPVILFWISAALLTYFAVKNDFSLIPVLGLLTNLYLISQLGITNWLRFLIWLVIGLIIYFSYGHKKSKLNKVLM
ncbi:MAG: amino acid permease [Deltaproteobacteria bacterium]